MTHLLHIDSSLRTEGSRSRDLSARYAASWRAANPDGVVTYRDLAAEPPPHLTWDGFMANMTPPEQHTPSQQAERALTETLAGEVVAADEIVVGMPLYNFGPPSHVKSWFDHLVVPGATVGLDGAGKLGGRRLAFVLARGGGYSPGAPREGWDHREPWLIHAFEQLALTDVRFIHAELTLARESPAMVPLDLGGAEDASMAAAQAEIDALFAPTGVAT
jgi:FMN-dependent NADH-azoreductase